MFQAVMQTLTLIIGFEKPNAAPLFSISTGIFSYPINQITSTSCKRVTLNNIILKTIVFTGKVLNKPDSAYHSFVVFPLQMCQPYAHVVKPFSALSHQDFVSLSCIQHFCLKHPSPFVGSTFYPILSEIILAFFLL